MFTRGHILASLGEFSLYWIQCNISGGMLVVVKPTEYRVWQPWFKFHHSLSIWPWIGFPNSPQCHLSIWEMTVLVLTSLNACIFYSVLQIATRLVTSHVFIISQFKWGRGLAEFSWILCSGSHEAAMKVSWGLSLQGLDRGAACFQAHLGSWHHSVLYNCKSEGPGFLLAVGQRHLSASRCFL